MGRRENKEEKQPCENRRAVNNFGFSCKEF